MTTVAPESTWRSIKETADLLGVHPRTLRRYIREGKLDVMRLSAQIVRITTEAIDAFQDAHVKVETGTGTAYVPRPKIVKGKPVGASAPHFSHGPRG